MKEDNIGCDKCGKCCNLKYVSEPPGVNIFEIRKIKKRTGMDEKQFTDAFIRHYGSYRVLKYKPDKNEDMICMFLENKNNGAKTCSIYDIRPYWCRVYPTDSKECISGRIIYPNLEGRIKKTIIAKLNSIKIVS